MSKVNIFGADTITTQLNDIEINLLLEVHGK